MTSLFAAFNVADGTVITVIHRRHRAIEEPGVFRTVNLLGFYAAWC